MLAREEVVTRAPAAIAALTAGGSREPMLVSELEPWSPALLQITMEFGDRIT